MTQEMSARHQAFSALHDHEKINAISSIAGPKFIQFLCALFTNQTFHLYSLGGSVPEGAEGQIDFLSPGPSFFGVIGSTALSRTSLSEPPRFLYLNCAGLASPSPRGADAKTLLCSGSPAQAPSGY